MERKKRITSNLSDIIDYLGRHFCTDFCERCPENKVITCEFIMKTAWNIFLYEKVSNKKVNEIINDTECPYNTERLIYGENKNATD